MNKVFINITTLIENGSYSKYYSRRRAYITRGLYKTLSSTFFFFPFFSFKSLLINNLII